MVYGCSLSYLLQVVPCSLWSRRNCRCIKLSGTVEEGSLAFPENSAPCSSMSCDLRRRRSSEMRAVKTRAVGTGTLFPVALAQGALLSLLIRPCGLTHFYGERPDAVAVLFSFSHGPRRQDVAVTQDCWLACLNVCLGLPFESCHPTHLVVDVGNKLPLPAS